MTDHDTIDAPRRRAGDEELRALIDEHGPAMFRLARSIVQDSALAEDVVQDAVIKVWDAYATFRGDAPIRAWILRITHNTAVSTLRRSRDEAWDPVKLPDEARTGLVEESAVARDDLDRLQVALGELDELSRSILTLREVEGLSYDDIAETLGVTLGQVKIRLLRARRKLQARVRGGEEVR